ncbi:MAG: D-alanyl-D-alanine carboxypeptidase/D-alanyl-D-alanine-endopeptidase [Bacteroidaceae bacterium]|nr:D-alanyl-D-alanine carboxypeptidase/D-alanyl-D-alanine-endopeptidase [Bacteroidaceae bacterium]
MKKFTIFLLFSLLLTAPTHADSKRKKKANALPDAVPTMVAKLDSLEHLLLLERIKADSVLQVMGDIKAGKTAPDAIDNSTPLYHFLDSLCHTPLLSTTQLGLYVYDITDQRDLFTYGHRQRLRPASCQKLVTAITAVHLLGGKYEFTTELRLEGEVSDSVLVGNVYVVGGMDPMLAQGEVSRMARALREVGIDSIAGSLFTDVSMKDDKPYGWGWCWDDDYGPLSALTVDGKDRFADHFLEALASAGVRLSTHCAYAGQAPSNSRVLVTVTHSIDQVLQRVLKNSDNIYAESLFYQIAAFGGKKNAGRKQAVQHIESLIRGLGLNPNNYQIADGSGLSLYNYVSPELLVRLLNFAWNNEAVRQHIYWALPIAGDDGTLSRRMSGTPAKDNVHAKTGTVEGVSSLSGYATAPNGHTLAFSIINVGVGSSSAGRTFQDKVCRALCEL